MKNKKMLVFGILVLTIISLSIGYSSYKSDLKITGIASNVRPITDIRVTDMSLEDDSTGLSTYNEYNYDRIITGFSVSNNQYMKYKVKVTNIGSTEMAITDISGVPETLNLELEDYTLNEKICNENNECKLGINKEFYIKLIGKQFSSVTDPIQEVYNLNLVFTFKPVYKVDYIDIENNDYPNEIVDGESLNIDLGENAPSNLIVKMDGVEINNYVYENNILTVQNVTGNVIIEKKSVCDQLSGDKNTPGSEYECEVKPGVKYNFYVLSNESDGTTNLIMNQNIYSDGTPSGMNAVTQESNEEKYSLIEWNLSGSNNDGPITAINFLYNATKDWVNIPPLNYSYMDKEFQETTATNTRYTSFISNNGVATITSLSGNIEVISSETIPLRARMPIYYANPDKGIYKGELLDKNENNSNAYLYANLDPAGSKPNGYWSLSSYQRDPERAWVVCYTYKIQISKTNFQNTYGVRPVINLYLNK